MKGVELPITRNSITCLPGQFSSGGSRSAPKRLSGQLVIHSWPRSGGMAAERMDILHNMALNESALLSYNGYQIPQGALIVTDMDYP